MKMTKHNSIYSICDSNDIKLCLIDFNTTENDQFLTQNDLMKDIWMKKSSQNSTLIETKFVKFVKLKS